jgi:hypothetical protein
MIKNIRGIEGDDLPYHLELLRLDANTFDPQILFWPLVDHYNTHDAEWLATYTNRAKSSQTIIFYDLVNTGDYEHTKFCEFISNFQIVYMSLMFRSICLHYFLFYSCVIT